MNALQASMKRSLRSVQTPPIRSELCVRRDPVAICQDVEQLLAIVEGVHDRGDGPQIRVKAPHHNRCEVMRFNSVVMTRMYSARSGTSKPASLFAGGVRWVHSGGIFAALSPTTAELAAEMMKEAKAAGAITSFDLNFREKLWKISGGSERAVETIGKIVENVDVLVGNEEDLQKGLGIPGPAVTAKSKLDPSVFFGMIDNVVKKHPQVKAVATTLREVHSTNRHSWSAVAWVDGKTFTAPTAELEVIDRVGGGDGFAAGFIYGLLTGEAPEEAIKLGWAHGALLTTFPGDTTMATVEQVRAFAAGASARIQR